MKRNLLLISLLIFIFACEKEEPEESLDIPINYIESTVELRVQDSKGVDLLNESNIGYYKSSDIHVIESLAEANSVRILQYPGDEYYYLTLYINYPKVDLNKGEGYYDELITKVRFGNDKVDEINGKYKIEYHEGTSQGFGTGTGYTIKLEKAWFNDVEIYNTTDISDSALEMPIVIKSPN